LGGSRPWVLAALIRLRSDSDFTGSSIASVRPCRPLSGAGLTSGNRWAVARRSARRSSSSRRTVIRSSRALVRTAA
jgi:hypothetical protein